MKKDQTPSDCAELTVAAAQEFRKASTGYIRLYDGVTDMLEQLKQAGKKLYVLSNAQRVFTFPEVQSLGIEGYFTDISLSSDFGAMKPDAAFYQQLLDRNHINPNRSIMVGNDAVCDVLAAKQVGLHTCYVHSNISPVTTISVTVLMTSDGLRENRPTSFMDSNSFSVTSGEAIWQFDNLAKCSQPAS